jgi:PelA/Pel-15E family pectate lyase
LDPQKGLGGAKNDKMKYSKLIPICFFLFHNSLFAQKQSAIINISGFQDSQHHWKDIADHEQVIVPVENQPDYKPDQIAKIADNILLYQQPNGGWPKNYDMLAILTKEQKDILARHKDSNNTTFDNGATYTQIEYLAKAYLKTNNENYKNAALKGINFMLVAQYNNGGWPQFYPDVKGYRKYITFNDDAMEGVMSVLHHIIENDPSYSFINNEVREKVEKSFSKGIDCILKCQIKENGKLTVWCQQHDNIDFSPRNARTFELASKAAEESANIVALLMSIKNPGDKIIQAVNAAIDWFNKVAIKNTRIKVIASTEKAYKFHSTNQDRIVVKDSTAPLIWTRYYELETDRPLFANRDGKKVYQLSDVSRERRTGYAWYGYWPQKMLKKYPDWLKKLKSMN